jgi:hypothetical protein
MVEQIQGRQGRFSGLIAPLFRRIAAGSTPLVGELDRVVA